MLDFYRLQQLANQRGLLRDKYIYRVLLEPPTTRVEGSRDLDLTGPRPKHVSRHAFRQRLPIAKYGPFREMHWENDLAARSEDTVETEPPKTQPSPLTTEGPPEEDDDTVSHSPSATKETDPRDDFPTDPPEERTYVDADAEVTEPEGYTLDTYDIMRDDPFAEFLRK